MFHFLKNTSKMYEKHLWENFKWRYSTSACIALHIWSLFSDIPPYWNFAHPPVNYHLYTSENGGSQATDTVSKSTLLHMDSGEELTWIT